MHQGAKEEKRKCLRLLLHHLAASYQRQYCYAEYQRIAPLIPTVKETTGCIINLALFVVELTSACHFHFTCAA